MEEKKLLTMFKKIYNYLLTIPDRLYPFRVINDEGVILFGQSAYDYEMKRNRRLFGYEFTMRSPKVFVYREVFHLLASIFLVYVAHILGKNFGTLNGIAFIILIVTSISFQEFYIHPKYYHQRTVKTITDWVVWMVPVLVYILA